MLIFLLYSYNIWQKVYASAFLGRDVIAIRTENKELFYMFISAKNIYI